MVSGLTVPSKRNDTNSTNNVINELRESIRFASSSSNTDPVTGTSFGGTSVGVSPTGLFSLNPQENIVCVKLIYQETTTTNPLEVGDEISGTGSWKGKLIQIVDFAVGGVVGKKEAIFEPSDSSYPSFTDSNQTLSKTGWSATYTAGNVLNNVVSLRSSSPIIATVDNVNPTVSTIFGTIHDGQILLMKPKEAKTLTLATGGNIDISSNVTVADSEMILLQYHEDAGNKYLVLSGSGSSGDNLGNHTASQDLQMSNNDIIGVANLDLDGVSATIEGVVNLQFYNTSNSINSISGGLNYSVNSNEFHRFIIGATEKVTINSTETDFKTDIDMNTYDVNNVDRLKFSTTQGSGSSLTSTDTGIEAIYTGSNPYGMKIQIPTANSAILQIYRGTTVMQQYDSFGSSFNTNVFFNNNYLGFASMTAPSHTIAGQRYLFQDSSDNHLKIRTNTGLIDLESGGSSWVGTATSNLNMNTYNVEGVDQLIFSTSSSSSDVLASTDYGIEIEGASASPSGLKYNVPSAKEHRFYVNGIEEMSLSSSGLDLLNNSITNVGTIYTDYIWMNNGTNPAIIGHFIPNTDNVYDLGSSTNEWRNLYVDGTANLDNVVINTGTGNFSTVSASSSFASTGTTTLGDSSTDQINVYGKVDFKNNTGTTGAQTAGTYNGNILSPQGYVTIKIGGTDKVIPYYST